VIKGPSYNFLLVAYRQMNDAVERTRSEDEAKTQTKYVAPGVAALSNFSARRSGPLRERSLIEAGANNRGIQHRNPIPVVNIVTTAIAIN